MHFEISPQARNRFYFEVEPELRAKLKVIAQQRGIPAEVLLDERVWEKMAETEAVGVTK